MEQHNTVAASANTCVARVVPRCARCAGQIFVLPRCTMLCCVGDTRAACGLFFVILIFAPIVLVCCMQIGYGALARCGAYVRGARARATTVEFLLNF